MAHAALSDPGPTYVLAHSLMTQVTASAHPSGGRGAFGVAVGWHGGGGRDSPQGGVRLRLRSSERAPIRLLH